MNDRITPLELKRRMDSGESIFLLDVREPEEVVLATLGGLLIPLRELQSRIEEIPRDRETVVLCHHGIRSAHACAFLKSAGFENVKNLSGGIDRWSIEADPKVPRY